MAGRRVVAFDPYAAAYGEDPHPTLRALREQGPVLVWEEGRALLVTTHEGVASLLADERFSLRFADWEHAPSAPEGRESEFELLMKHGLFGVRRADHLRLRKLVSPSFTPRAIAVHRPRIEAIVEELLGALDGAGSFDVMRDFAELLPVRVISAVLDIPPDQAELFRRFSVALVDASSPSLPPEEFARVTAVLPEGVAMLREVIDERRARGGDDLLSQLIRAEEDGERLSTRELLSLVAALIAAGSETTVHLLGFAVLELHRHPAQRRLLHERPDLTVNALLEVLRHDNFGRLGVARFARDALELGGVPVRKGQVVYPLFGAALRDPAAFPDPDTFDITRDQTSNIAFGQGLHYCLGAALARLEGEIALTALLARFPALEVERGPLFEPHHFMRKIGALELRA